MGVYVIQLAYTGPRFRLSRKHTLNNTVSGLHDASGLHNETGKLEAKEKKAIDCKKNICGLDVVCL